jgi:hypothetical protein
MQHIELAKISQGLVAVRHFGPAFVSFGSKWTQAAKPAGQDIAAAL